MMRCLLALAGLVGYSLVLAAEVPINIDAEKKAKYFAMEKGGTAEKPILVIRRLWTDGSSNYSKRQFDCKARTQLYIGEGESLEEMAKPLFTKEKALPPNAGSVGEELLKYACGK